MSSRHVAPRSEALTGQGFTTKVVLRVQSKAWSRRPGRRDTMEAGSWLHGILLEHALWGRAALARCHLFPVIAGLCVTACLLYASGCLKQETNVQRGDREQVLHRGIGADPTDLDPHVATSLA